MNNIEFHLISEAMKVYVEMKKLAAADLDGVSDQAMPGAETNRRMAAHDAEQTAALIRNLVELDSAAIFPVGPTDHQAQFAALAEDEGEAIVIPADQVYRKLAEETIQFLDRGNFGITTAQALAARMYKVATWIRVMSYVQPHLGSSIGTAIPDIDAMTTLVRNLIRSANKDEFNSAYISHVVFEKVIETEYCNNGVTVVVTGTTEDEAKGDLAQKLFGGHTLIVDVTKVPEKNDLVLAAKQLKPFFARAWGVFNKMNAQKARTAKAQKAAEEAAASENDSIKKATSDAASITADEANNPAA